MRFFLIAIGLKLILFTAVLAEIPGYYIDNEGNKNDVTFKKIQLTKISCGIKYIKNGKTLELKPLIV